MNKGTVANFIKVQLGDYRYLFFLVSDKDTLLSPDAELQKRFDLFGEELQSSGMIVHSFTQARESTFQQIMKLNWSGEAMRRLQAQKVPFMLILEKGLKTFDPQKDRWGLLFLHDNLLPQLDKILSEMALLSRHQSIFSYLDEVNFLGPVFPDPALVSDQAQLTILPPVGGIWVNPIFADVPPDRQYESDIFVLMPFADEFKAVFTNIIQPVGQEMGLKKVLRGDDFFSNHHIMDEVWYAISKTQIVIADCTGRNPNVFYELGIAHTLGKPTILLTQNVKDAPFDVAARRFITYENTLAGADNLKKELREKIGKIIENKA
jgi:hypothetical protein